VPQPAYTDRAREAGVEGKVRIELTVDETGRVVSVKVLSGLGYGLDEAAVAAAQSATFEPAIRCGKPTRATFTISMRFSSS
jgi:protein TonB